MVGAGRRRVSAEMFKENGAVPVWLERDADC